MNALNEFLKSKTAKRFYWQILNSVMGLIVAWITLLTTENVSWAILVLPIANGLSQMLTKELNTKFSGVRYNK